MEPVLWPDELDEAPIQPRRRPWWRRLLDRLRTPKVATTRENPIMNKRAELRRQWRADRKNLKRQIVFRDWTPNTFDAVKASIRKARGS
jgi:hypothetical protein